MDCGFWADGGRDINRGSARLRLFSQTGGRGAMVDYGLDGGRAGWRSRGAPNESPRVYRQFLALLR